MNKFANVIVENIKTISIFVGVIVLALFGFAFYAQHQDSREQENINALYEVRTAADKELSSKNWEAAASLYENFAKDYSGSRAAFEAMLARADIFVDNKKFSEAITIYDSAIGIAPDPLMKHLSIYSKGTVEELSGNCQSAVETYEAAFQKKGNTSLNPEILLAKGRCFEKLKQIEAAREVYQTIIADYAKNRYYKDAATIFLSKLGQTASKKKDL